MANGAAARSPPARSHACDRRHSHAGKKKPKLAEACQKPGPIITAEHLSSEENEC
jgi:hypothetical protein